MKPHTCGCTESQINKRPRVTFLTFLLSCNLFCRICLVMVISCHGVYASPSPAPLENSKHKLNEKSCISYMTNLKGAQKQAEMMLCKMIHACSLLKTQTFLMLTFKKFLNLLCLCHKAVYINTVVNSYHTEIMSINSPQDLLPFLLSCYKWQAVRLLYL